MVLTWHDGLEVHTHRGEPCHSVPWYALKTLRVCLGWARRLGLVLYNPASSLNVRYRSKPGNPLTLSQVGKFWRELDTTARRRVANEKRRGKEKPYLTALNSAPQALRVLLMVGARQAEIVTARITQFDEERRRVSWKRGKNGKPRHIVLPALAFALVKRQVAVAKRLGSPFIFPSPANLKRHVSKWSVWSLMKEVAEAAGIKDVSPHDLRHTFADHLLSLGADLDQLKRLLGHETDEALKIYTRNATPPGLHKTAERYGKRLEAAIRG